MNNLQEEPIRAKRIFEGKVINLRIDTVRLPNGKEAEREIVEHPGAVAIVPILSDGRVIMVRQYRHPAGKILLEIPAGKLDKGEDPEHCALRELEEETGYYCQELRHLTSTWTTPGFSNEMIHIYSATNLEATSQKLDEDEFLSIEIYTPEDVRCLIRDGTICDSKTLVGLYLAGI